MSKRVLSLVTVVAFLLFDWSCLSITNVPVTSVASKDQIVGLTRISGESMQFSKENPARIIGDRLVIEINTVALSDVKGFRQDGKGLVYEITTKDGRTIHDIEGKREGEKIVLPPLSIPLSEVKLVTVRRSDTGMTILLVLGIIAGLYGLLYILYKISSPGGYFNLGQWETKLNF